jgi:hypothetical protein
VSETTSRNLSDQWQKSASREASVVVYSRSHTGLIISRSSATATSVRTCDCCWVALAVVLSVVELLCLS